MSGTGARPQGSPLVPFAPAAVAPAAAPSLEALRWRKRVIVVVAPSAADARLQGQRRELETLVARADDGDLHLAFVAGAQVDGLAGSAAELRRRLHVPADAFSVVLVGKDGGVKLSEPGVTPAARFAELIDAMPMRRDEMRPR